MYQLVRTLARPVYERVRRLFYGRSVRWRVGGVRFQLDLSERIDSSLFFRGVWEPHTTQALARLVKPDMVVIDVGANIGAHTLAIARRLNPSEGKIIAFEATSYAFQKLQRNAGLNSFPHLQLENFALAEEEGVQVLDRASSPETMPFKASWDLRTGTTHNRSVDTIRFRRLDSYVAEQGLSRLDLMKIDVDGYEMRVLRGGINTIMRFRPVILIEVGRAMVRLGHSYDEFIALMDQISYSLCTLDGKRQYIPSELPAVLANTNGIDFLAYPRS